MKTPDGYRLAVNRFKALSGDDESILIKENSNDYTKLRDLLFYHNIRYALSIASEYDGLGNVHGGEDCIQNAILGLYKASRKFDISAGTKFTTYATYYIRSEILYFTRLTENNVSVNTISMNKKVVSHDNEDIREICDVIHKYVEPTVSIGSEQSVNDWSNVSNIIRHVVNSDVRLPQKHRDMFFAYYLSPEQPSIKYMMNRFGLSKRRITQILRGCKDSVMERLARFFPKEVFVEYGIDSIFSTRDEQENSSKKYVACESPRYSHLNYEKFSVKRNSTKIMTTVRWRPESLHEKIYGVKSKVNSNSHDVSESEDASEFIVNQINASDCGREFDEEAHFVD